MKPNVFGRDEPKSPVREPSFTGLGRPISGRLSLETNGNSYNQRSLITFSNSPRQILIGMLLIIALLAFEVFNFDSTQFALDSLLGSISFIQLRWATILAIAFCAIDFAGLAHLFSSSRLIGPNREILYLMGAWLLGATMNALMTWWAVSLALLAHDFGNELISREQLLRIVPIFVAVLVWLTRVLFIGAFSIAGYQFFGSKRDGRTVGLVPDISVGHRRVDKPTEDDSLNSSTFSPNMADRPTSYRQSNIRLTAERAFPIRTNDRRATANIRRPARPMSHQNATASSLTRRNRG